MSYESLMAIAAAFFLVTVSPGPANIAVSSVSVSQGRRSGLLFGLGLSLGLAFWGAIAATGLGALLQTTSHLLAGLKILGGLYLIWLAIQSARSAIKPDWRRQRVADGGRWFWRGLLLNLSNPKAVVAWMAALSMGLGGAEDIIGLMVATLTCVLIGFVNYAAYALFFSTAAMMRGYARLRRWIDGAVAVLFALAGLSLIRSAFSR